MSRRHPGANNLARAGHRGWEISTAGTTHGLGYGTYAGRNVPTLHVLDNAAFDSSQLGRQVIQPAVPWSVHPGNAYQAPDSSTVTVVLVRARQDAEVHDDVLQAELSAALSRAAYSAASAAPYLVRGQKKPRRPSPLVRGTT